MKENTKTYDTPLMEYIEIAVETAILIFSGDNLENPSEGEESDWL